MDAVPWLWARQNQGYGAAQGWGTTEPSDPACGAWEADRGPREAAQLKPKVWTGHPEGKRPREAGGAARSAVLAMAGHPLPTSLGPRTACPELGGRVGGKGGLLKKVLGTMAGRGSPSVSEAGVWAKPEQEEGPRVDQLSALMVPPKVCMCEGHSRAWGLSTRALLPSKEQWHQHGHDTARAFLSFPGLFQQWTLTSRATPGDWVHTTLQGHDPGP